MKTLSRLHHAMLAPHISPATKSPPNAAAAILWLRESLMFGGWTPWQVRAELHRLGSKTRITKGTPR